MSSLLLPDLPTLGRSYPENAKISVKGYTYDQVLALSTFLSPEQDYEFSTLWNIIKDSISVDNIDSLEDIELADFHYCMLASGLITDPDQKWAIHEICDHCSSPISTELDITDIKYTCETYKLINGSVPVSFSESIKVKPLTIQSKLTMEDAQRLFKTSSLDISQKAFTNLLSYAVSMIGASLQDSITLLNENPSYIKEIKEINKLLQVSIDPVNIACPKCENSTLVTLELDSLLRRYL